MASDLNDLKGATWLNPPPGWSHDTDGLSVSTGHETDFWRETYYGFHRDNGHFLGIPTQGDFTAIVTFDGAYETLYDQAGLMLRLDERRWLKAGIEFSDGVTNFSSVVTRDRSDWAVISVPRVVGPQSVRLTRTAGRYCCISRTQLARGISCGSRIFPQTATRRLESWPARRRDPASECSSTNSPSGYP